MNNEENNNINGIITPQPIMPNETSNNNSVLPAEQTTTNDNNGTQPNAISPQPITPITPIVPDENINNPKDVSIIEPVQSNNVATITPSSPNLEVIMPQMKNEDNNTIASTLDNNTPQTNNSGTLKLEGSSPFDIGVGSQSVVAPDTSNVIQVNNTQTNNNTQEPTITPTNTESTQDINPPIIKNNDNVVSVGQYLLHIILFSIPVIGFIMLIIKAIDKNNKNISNLAKAYLLIQVIGFILSFVVFLIFGATILGYISNHSGNIDYTTTTNYDYSN